VGAALSRLTPAYPKSLELRIVTGLYFDRLTEEAAKSGHMDDRALEADRIGYRYRKGRPLTFRERKQPFGAGSDPSNIVDAGFPYGSIQVPGGLVGLVSPAARVGRPGSSRTASRRCRLRPRHRRLDFILPDCIREKSKGNTPQFQPGYPDLRGL
jgi:hypothetical protein